MTQKVVMLGTISTVIDDADIEAYSRKAEDLRRFVLDR
jgi:hypothetical protein